MDQNENMGQAEQVVNEHRQMFLLTGNLSDFQLENLKKWPFIIFGKDLKKAEIAYDFKMEQPDDVNARDLKAGSVTFDLFFKKKPEQDFIASGLAMLQVWTKFMFWSDTEVILKLKGKKWVP
jgi:hypothetical protein